MVDKVVQAARELGLEIETPEKRSVRVVEEERPREARFNGGGSPVSVAPEPGGAAPPSIAD